MSNGREALKHGQLYVKGGDVAARVFQEPTIVINGHALTKGQVMTVRCAIENFARAVLEPEVGDIGTAYLERVRELRRMMYEEGR